MIAVTCVDLQRKGDCSGLRAQFIRRLGTGVARSFFLSLPGQFSPETAGLPQPQQSSQAERSGGKRKAKRISRPNITLPTAVNYPT